MIGPLKGMLMDQKIRIPTVSTLFFPSLFLFFSNSSANVRPICDFGRYKLTELTQLLVPYWGGWWSKFFSNPQVTLFVSTLTSSPSACPWRSLSVFWTSSLWPVWAPMWRRRSCSARRGRRAGFSTPHYSGAGWCRGLINTQTGFFFHPKSLRIRRRNRMTSRNKDLDLINPESVVCSVLKE